MYTITASTKENADDKAEAIWAKDDDNYVRLYRESNDSYYYPCSTPFGIVWSLDCPFSAKEMLEYFNIGLWTE
jgi:hypothetical protein